jgi:hypothetical protein
VETRNKFRTYILEQFFISLCPFIIVQCKCQDMLKIKALIFYHRKDNVLIINKKSISILFLCIFLPVKLQGCTKLRNEIETQRTKRNETKYYETQRNILKWETKRNEKKYTKMRNETQRNGIHYNAKRKEMNTTKRNEIY